jgi:hypothetical protein
MKTNALTEAEAGLMFAEVGGGWININLLANLTPKQLETAHIDDEHNPDCNGELVIDVWLNDGEFATLAGGFTDEKVAEIILYFIKPKANPEEYKDVKVDDLTVFEFRPDHSQEVDCDALREEYLTRSSAMTNEITSSNTAVARQCEAKLLQQSEEQTLGMAIAENDNNTGERIYSSLIPRERKGENTCPIEVIHA